MRDDRISRAMLNIKSSDAAQSAHAIFNVLQQMPPEKAIIGSAIAFIMLGEAYGVSPRKALEVAERASRDAKSTTNGDVLLGAIGDLLQAEMA